ncbi:unnamed protein product [Cunninghamella blakesleeana]
MILQRIALKYETNIPYSIKRSYSIMNRAKQRAGILNLIQPKAPNRNAGDSKENVIKYVDTNYQQSKRKPHSPRINKNSDNKRNQYQINQCDEHILEAEYGHHQRKNKDDRFTYGIKRKEIENSYNNSNNNNADRWAATPLRVKHDNDDATKSNQWKRSSKSSPVESDKEIVLTEYFKKINETKAAGMSERLIKPIKHVEQPIDPHLLKVTIIGPPNAGKSTLVNKLVGEDISIVSSKLHTTRERILAILTQDKYQVVFLDTPGVISPQSKEKMNRSVTTSSWRSLDEADHVLIMVDGDRITTSSSKHLNEYIISRLSELNLPATLVFNKMDITAADNKVELETIANEFKKELPNLNHVLYISALEENGLDELKKILFDSSKPKLWLYPKDLKLEMSDLKRVEELIRVQFFKRLNQYLPYMLKQENVGWTELENGTLRIEQNVYVERDSQHKIVVGANGMIINRVIEDARKEISKAFKRRVQLFIQVKTRKK